MNHLSDNEITELRSELERELGSLVKSMAITDEALRPVQLDQTAVGRLSRMDALQGQAMSQELGRRRRLELQKIAGALARIASGDFGWCSRCGEEIDIRRLELDPAAPLCIGCASARED